MERAKRERKFITERKSKINEVIRIRELIEAKEGREWLIFTKKKVRRTFPVLRKNQNWIAVTAST